MIERKRKICRKKQIFKKPTDAAKRISDNWLNNKIMTHAYWCNVCGLIHLTSGGLK